MNKLHSLALGSVLGAAALVAPSASAADWNFGFSFGRPQPVFAPQQPRVVQQWVPGFYETRTEQVLVSPERHEKVWVEPVYRTEKHRDHVHQELVAAGYFKDVCIPAQYQTVQRQVFVPGYYKEVVVAPTYPNPTFQVAVGGNDHHDHGNWDRNDRDGRNDRNDRNDRNNDRNDRNDRPVRPTTIGYR